MEYRDDEAASRHQYEVLNAEADLLRRQNAMMRQELEHRRARTVVRSRSVYEMDAWRIPPGEQVMLAHHRLEKFPVWAAAVLHFITFGLFSIIHYGLQHDRIPQAADSDPTAAKAIGFSFIPYFNLYWGIFNPLRLADRINLQYRLRGMPNGLPRGLILACGITAVIPYVNLFIGIPIMWTIGVVYLQKAINELAELGPGLADVQKPPPQLPPHVAANPYGLPPAYPPGYAPPQNPDGGGVPPPPSPPG